MCMVFVLGTDFFINPNTAAFCWLGERRSLTVSSNSCHLVDKWFQAGSSPKNLLDWGEVDTGWAVLHSRNMARLGIGTWKKVAFKQEVTRCFRGVLSGIQKYCWALLLKNLMLMLKHKNVTFQITFPPCSATSHLEGPRNVPDEAPEWLLRVTYGQGQWGTEPTSGLWIPRNPGLWSWETLGGNQAPVLQIGKLRVQR